jgi:hypothetical protein
VDAGIVGRTYPATDPFEVTEERVRAFVESTGAAYDGSVPPTFPMTPAFGSLLIFLEVEGLDLARLVHGEQRFTYVRPIAVGDVLTCALTIASLRTIGGNDILGTSSDLVDRDGTVVCTGNATFVHRGEEVTA